MALEPFPASPQRREPSLAAMRAGFQASSAPYGCAESWPRRADWSRRWLRLFVFQAETAITAAGLRRAWRLDAGVTLAGTRIELDAPPSSTLRFAGGELSQAARRPR